MFQMTPARILRMRLNMQPAQRSPRESSDEIISVTNARSSKTHRISLPCLINKQPCHLITALPLPLPLPLPLHLQLCVARSIRPGPRARSSRASTQHFHLHRSRGPSSPKEITRAIPCDPRGHNSPFRPRVSSLNLVPPLPFAAGGT